MQFVSENRCQRKPALRVLQFLCQVSIHSIFYPLVCNRAMADNAVTASTFSGWQKRFGVMLQEYVVSSCPLQRERFYQEGKEGGRGKERGYFW